MKKMYTGKSMDAKIESSPFIGCNIFALSQPVIACSEAAYAKRIPLRNELKSLVLDTSKGTYMLHIPGDRKANLRSVKRALGVNEARLADDKTLEMLKTGVGRVTPLLKQLWELPQLLSLDVLLCEYVSTNAGELDKYVVFSPLSLLLHPDSKVGYYTK